MESIDLTRVVILGNLSYVLLMSSSLVRDVLKLRLLAIASGIAAIIYGVSYSPPLVVDICWEAIFVTINTVQSYFLVRDRRRVRLTEEEKRLHSSKFPKLTPVDFHRLVRMGTWMAASSEAVLTHQGAPVGKLMLLTEGLASAAVNGTVVGRYRTGDVIGEIAFLSGRPATATVQTVAPTRYIVWNFSDLQALCAQSPEIQSSMQSVFTATLLARLVGQATGERAFA